MIIDTHLHPTNLVDEAWRHTGEPFTGERMLKLMDGPYMINGKPRRIDMGFTAAPGNTVIATATAVAGGRARLHVVHRRTVHEVPGPLHRQLQLQPALGAGKRCGGAGIPYQGIRFQDAQAARQHARLSPGPGAGLAASGDEGLCQIQHRGVDPHGRWPVHDSDDVLSDHPRVPDGQFIIGHSVFRPAATTRSKRSGWRWTRRTCTGSVGASSHGSRVRQELPRNKIVFGTDSPPNERACGCVNWRCCARQRRRSGIDEIIGRYLGNTMPGCGDRTDATAQGSVEADISLTTSTSIPTPYSVRNRISVPVRNAGPLLLEKCGLCSLERCWASVSWKMLHCGEGLSPLAAKQPETIPRDMSD